MAVTWPIIGKPNLAGANTIPAKQKFVAGTELTFCLADYPATYIFSGIGK